MYKQTARALRMIGRDCIKKRIEMVESGAEVPNDILTHILQVACELKNQYYKYSHYSILALMQLHRALSTLKSWLMTLLHTTLPVCSYHSLENCYPNLSMLLIFRTRNYKQLVVICSSHGTHSSNCP